MESRNDVLNRTAAWVGDRAPLDHSLKETLEDVSASTPSKLRFFQHVMAERKAAEASLFAGIGQRVWEELFSEAKIRTATTKELIMMAALVKDKQKDDLEYIQKVTEKVGMGAGSDTVLEREERRGQASQEQSESIRQIAPARRDILRSAFEKLISAVKSAPKSA